MRLDEYAAHDATGLARLLASGDIAPNELGRCLVEATARVNPALNAVLELYHDALEALPGAAGPGPFHCIPTLTKDFPIEAGRPAGFGSRLARGFRARADAIYWKRARVGGVVNAGRTTSSAGAFRGRAAARPRRLPPASFPSRKAATAAVPSATPLPSAD